MSVTSTIIKGNIVTPDSVLYGGWIEVVGDTIVTVEGGNVPIPDISKQRKCRDLTITSTKIVESPWVIPGFVDIHNHGCGGAEEMADNWINPEYTTRYLAEVGTLSTLASLLFPKDHINTVYKVIDKVENAVGKVIPNCAMIEGIHAEGPVLHDFGGQPAPESDISLDNFKALCKRMPHLKVMTIAPTRESGRDYERMRHLQSINCRISLGHDRHCTEKDIIGALKIQYEKEIEEAEKKQHSPEELHQKYRMHCTHMFNVMQHDHKAPSLVNFLLCNKVPNPNPKYDHLQVPTVEIIGDLIHVHPVVVQSVLSARKMEDICMITDCISKYEIGKQIQYNGRIAAVRAQGGVFLLDKFGRMTQTLAGSCSNLSDQFYNLMCVFRIGIMNTCNLLCTNPAKFAKIEHVGSLAVGKKANILLLNNELNTINSRMIYGNWVEAKPYKFLKTHVSHI